VNVNGDNLRENDEYYYLYLSSPVNGTIVNSPGTGVIVNDDQYPAILVGDVSVYEGQTGTTKAAFKVSLTSASPNTVQLTYSTSDWTATAGSDYVSTSGSLTFNPGTTSQTVTVTVHGDTPAEDNQYFHLNLAAPSYADIV